MAQLSELREALAANLSSMPDCQVSAYVLANPTPPVVHVAPAGTEYDLTFGRGLDTFRFTVQGIVGTPSDIGAQQRLDRWLAAEGVESIKQLVESDKRLGGLAQDTRVVSVGPYTVVVLEGKGQMLMAEWTVEVLATSS